MHQVRAWNCFVIMPVLVIKAKLGCLETLRKPQDTRHPSFICRLLAPPKHFVCSSLIGMVPLENPFKVESDISVRKGGATIDHCDFYQAISSVQGLENRLIPSQSNNKIPLQTLCSPCTCTFHSLGMQSWNNPTCVKLTCTWSRVRDTRYMLEMAAGCVCASRFQQDMNWLSRELT